jgi:hypothetical protein
MRFKPLTARRMVVVGSVASAAAAPLALNLASSTASASIGCSEAYLGSGIVRGFVDSTSYQSHIHAEIENPAGATANSADQAINAYNYISVQESGSLGTWTTSAWHWNGGNNYNEVCTYSNYEP